MVCFPPVTNRVLSFGSLFLSARPYGTPLPPISLLVLGVRSGLVLRCALPRQGVTWHNVRSTSGAPCLSLPLPHGVRLFGHPWPTYLVALRGDTVAAHNKWRAVRNHFGPASGPPTTPPLMLMGSSLSPAFGAFPSVCRPL